MHADSYKAVADFTEDRRCENLHAADANFGNLSTAHNLWCKLTPLARLPALPSSISVIFRFHFLISQCFGSLMSHHSHTLLHCGVPCGLRGLYFIFIKTIKIFSVFTRTVLHLACCKREKRLAITADASRKHEVVTILRSQEIF